MSSPLEILDQQEAERAKELKKLAQTPCYDHTQCGEDCLSDCPHYAERNPDEKAKPAYKYGLEFSEPQKRLWVGEVINGSVYKCLYSDTWGGIRMIGTREKTIENAKLIVKALNAFDSSVDAPYCHDLEQRIELLEMQLEEAQAKAAACDRIMGGGKKTLKEWANIFGLPFAVGHNGQGIAFKCKNLPIVAGLNWWPTDVGDFGFAFIDSSFIDYTGDWKDSLTQPDGWEESK